MAIKKLNPSARFEIIVQTDEAVDKSDKVEADKRYSAYLESLDKKDLKMVEGKAPTLFIVRPLTNVELAELNSRYLVVDTEKKSAHYRDQTKMFLEMFDLCCVEMKDEGSPAEKVTSADVPYACATEVGSIISLIATLGKHTKKA